MAISFSREDARVTVGQLNEALQGMAEKNEARYRKASDASSGIGIAVSDTEPPSVSIWLKPMDG